MTLGPVLETVNQIKGGRHGNKSTPLYEGRRVEMKETPRPGLICIIIASDKVCYVNY